MPANGVPEDVRAFIFEFIDSVEQLEVLLLVRSQPSREWSVSEVTDALRTDAGSAAHRLRSLKEMGFIASTDTENARFRFQPQTERLQHLSDLLAATYKIRRHAVLELIFSPLKRIKTFASAFVVRGTGNTGGNDV